MDTTFLEALFTGKYGGYLIMAALFGVIVLILRTLFGPKGFFRDPEWDRCNEELRQEEAARRAGRLEEWQRRHGQEETLGSATTPPFPKEGGTQTDSLPPLGARLNTSLPQNLPPYLERHCRRFLDYVLPFTFRPEDGPVRIKVQHSLRVFEHVRLLLAEERADDPRAFLPHSLPARAAELAALYHDCGRFPQFREYGTFLDAVSVNHARLGLKVMKEEKFLSEEQPQVQHLAHLAVLLHNRFALPSRLDPVAARITHMVRDADKVDIMRVMAAHLHAALPEKDAVFLSVKDEPDKYSPKILDDVLHKRVPRYADLRYINDFKLLLGTWVRDLRFEASRRTIRKSGLIEDILVGLPDTEEIRQATKIIYEGFSAPLDPS